MPVVRCVSVVEFELVLPSKEKVSRQHTRTIKVAAMVLLLDIKQGGGRCLKQHRPIPSIQHL